MSDPPCLFARPTLVSADPYKIPPRSRENEATQGHLRNYLFFKVTTWTSYLKFR
jgi:hypothetical protein